MSALAFIRDYGEISSDDSDTESEKNNSKKPKFPRPNLSEVPTVTSVAYVDNPALHNGRLRSFPHVRGSWASFVYVKYPEDVIVHLINELKKLVWTIDESCQTCDNIHLSLSKTFVLQYHLINTFTTSLHAALGSVERFNLQFDCVEVYCNDEDTRTFIALKVDNSCKKNFLNISKKVDEVLKEFRLPPFYKDPSFHSSILWVVGNKKTEFEGILDQFNNILAREFESFPKAVLIDRVHCKIGNKQYQYCLK